jgi:hypothetical protein
MNKKLTVSLSIYFNLWISLINMYSSSSDSEEEAKDPKKKSVKKPSK